MAVLLGLAGSRAALAAGGLFEVEGRPAERVRVIVPGADGVVDVSGLAESWMGRRVSGVLAILDASDLKRFNSMVIGKARRDRFAGFSSDWLRVVAGRGDEVDEGVVGRMRNGRLAVRFAGDGRWCLLDEAKFLGLIGAPREFFLGAFGDRPAGDAVARVREETLTAHGYFEVDRARLASRFFSGFAAPTAAKLKDDERFQFRVPMGYDPRAPAGLLVWVSPAESGSPPRAFFEAADEMGLILAGADACGNKRPPADRLQLSLDVTARMVRDFHIDPRRVYITGLSGGGKMATILQACCPEIYRGCVPIVGTGWWRDVSISRDSVWPRLFGAPTKETQAMLRECPIAPVTGTEDFNHGPVLASVKQMNEDAMSVRLFDVEGLGHELPSEAVLRDALRWIDEPWREARAREEARGRELMAEYLVANKPESPRTPEARALLERLTAEAPWTEESWQAIEWLMPRDGEPNRE